MAAGRPCSMEAATGERIVAFGRVGKPLENRVFCGRSGPPSTPRDMAAMQRILKPHGVRLWSGELPTWLSIETIEQKARDAQIVESARVDHARGRFCRAPMRGAGSVHDGGEGHDRRSQLAAGEVAAGVFARRQDRTPLRSGLAPRQIGRRQVRPLASGTRSASGDKRRDAKIPPGHDGCGAACGCRVAEQPRPQKPDKAATSGKLLPLKRSNSANACAEYGAGFVKIEGTNTCMKIGGAVSIGAGVSSGSR